MLFCVATMPILCFNALKLIGHGKPHYGSEAAGTLVGKGDDKWFSLDSEAHCTLVDCGMSGSHWWLCGTQGCSVHSLDWLCGIFIVSYYHCPIIFPYDITTS